MYVVIHHQLQDAERFWEIAAQDPPPPPGSKNLMFFPSTDNTAAFCLYETDSLESLRRYVDEGLGRSSVNRYYPVNSEAALGLPE